MNVLVLNCGSSSLKFQLVETDLEFIERNEDRLLAAGVIERIGSESLITIRVPGSPVLKRAAPLRDHRAALDYVRGLFQSGDVKVAGTSSLADIHAVGHRIVHGGEKLSKSALIDQSVIEQIEDCIELAPLHNPANLKGIAAATSIFGDSLPQVAVFDTSFHATMRATAFLYALPYQLYVRHRIRRYGFHGTSHRFVAYRYRQLTGKSREETNILTAHLGNGSSMCAIRAGESVDTSMGMTPVEGLVMGTRAGDLDPSILPFLQHKEGMLADELDGLLNKRSGLLGISGLTNDMRDLLEEERVNQDRRAGLAIDIFCQRVRKYIGAYLAVMNGADALVFTGGIGENSDEIRRRICAEMDFFGIGIDPEKNTAAVGGVEGDISTAESRLRVFVIPTNEKPPHRAGYGSLCPERSASLVDDLVAVSNSVHAWLAIMAKAPRAGLSKTRLIPLLGAEGAASIAEAMLRDTTALCSSVATDRLSVHVALCYTPPDGEAEVRIASPGVGTFLPQRGKSLGQRLSTAFEDLFQGNVARVVVVGSDSPTLPPEILEQAFSRLASGVDVVIGPTRDGGYYLIGLGRPTSALFVAIPWSTSRVLAATLDRAAAAGLTVELLPEWYDVDDGDDLEHLESLMATGYEGAPATRAALASWRRSKEPL